MNNPKIETENYNNKNFPKVLYKHYSLNNNSISILTEKQNPYIFFSHPNLLNDLMDGSQFLLDFQNINLQNFSLLLQGIWSHLGISNKDFIAEYSTEKLNELYESDKKNDFYEIKQLFTFIDSFGRGVLSLTETNNNNLLWAHYSGEDGFVIEFNTELLLKEITNEKAKTNIFKINYTDKIYPINFANYLSFDNNRLDFMKPILYYLSTKIEDWKYENEWRILIQKNKLGFARNKIDFISHRLRDKILNQETKKADIFNLENRKIEITREVISKIILGPYFFNNNYFSDINRIDNQISYFFKSSLEISKSEFEKLQLFIKFIKTLKTEYNAKIEQLLVVKNKDSEENNILERKVINKITIVEMTDFFLTIKIEQK